MNTINKRSLIDVFVGVLVQDGRSAFSGYATG